MFASIITTIADEPRERLQRMVDRLAVQTVGPLEVVIAAPARDKSTIESLRAHGEVAAIIAVENPDGRRCSGLNRAVATARADVVHRVDARSLVDPRHVERCQARLDADPSVGVVGGRQHSVSVHGSVVARGLARALANPWATGGASYRRAGAAGRVDTVYLGSFRRAELRALGGYDEALDANEDFDLCQRYRAIGKAVWLEEDLVVDYEARARVRDVWRQYVAFGESKVRYWHARGERPNTRQWIGMSAPLAGFVAFVVAARNGRAAALVAAVAAGALAIDAAADGDNPSTGERAVAAVGAVLVPTAWAVGTYRELLRRSTASVRARPSPTASSPGRR